MTIFFIFFTYLFIYLFIYFILFYLFIYYFFFLNMEPLIACRCFCCYIFYFCFSKDLVLQNILLQLMSSVVGRP